MLTAISPTPNAYSILNCPGANAGRDPSYGASSSVAVSASSRRVRSTRYSCGRSASGRGCRASSALAVDIENLQLGRVQALREHRQEALHHVVAEVVIRLALVAKASGVDADRTRQGDRARVMHP